MALRVHPDELASTRMSLCRAQGRFGFAASEADGRFRRHAQAVVDEDFATLQRWLERMLVTPGG